jgi:hypothetical protein
MDEAAVSIFALGNDPLVVTQFIETMELLHVQGPKTTAKRYVTTSTRMDRLKVKMSISTQLQVLENHMESLIDNNRPLELRGPA